MSTASTTPSSGRASGRAKSHAWLVPLARAGYAARGVVYLLVGSLAILAAIGRGGETTGSRGALQSIGDEVWGQVFLVAIGVGLLGYALWRFFQSVIDADGHGKDGKGLVIRVGCLVSSATHLLLAGYILTLLLGSGGDGGEGGKKAMTAWLMSQPFGVWLVGAVGVCIIGAGVAQLIKGVKGEFEKWLRLDGAALKRVSPVCRVGLIARALTFWIIGGFIIVAAIQTDPDEARGLGGALQTLSEQPYGPWLLGAVALGLIAFAVYSFFEAAYRRISPSSP